MKPNKLKKDDYMAAISLSGLLKEKNISDINESINNASSIGLNVITGKYIYRIDNQEIINNEELINHKLYDLNTMLENNNVNAIIFNRGGNDSNLLLNKLDYQKIANTKKVFIGLSDLTVILNAIYAKTGLITFHFCIFKGFLKGNEEFNKHNFTDMFFNNSKKINLSHELLTIRSGLGTGRLIGGNLISFCKLIDTNYMPILDQYVLFFEECDEVDKQQLLNLVIMLRDKKILEKASGILLGNYNIDNNYFAKVFKDNTRDVPILKCSDFGHCENNVVLPIGALVKLDCDNKELEVIEDIFE